MTFTELSNAAKKFQQAIIEFDKTNEIEETGLQEWIADIDEVLMQISEEMEEEMEY